MKKKERLIYLPLGGAGEIGMNMYLYGYGENGKESFIIIDVGVAFPDMESTPGVDLIMANPKFIEENRERLVGIFITHAHEDHIGAIGHLFGFLNAPIYCRKFTSEIGYNKLRQLGITETKISVVNAYPEEVNVGPFKVSFLPTSHSIPEASNLVIDTPIGRIIHTGDFKIDKTPVLGDPFNERLLSDVTKSGVLALVCDSTNVFSENPGRSELSLKGELIKLIKNQNGIVVATTFASNIARLLTLARCAHSSGRSILVLGRAMHTMISAAISVGILKDFPPIISTKQALETPRSNLFILATGSQGEGRAASAQLSRDKYMDIMLQEGDCFLFSSKTIPGNELPVSKIINGFMSRGIKVINDDSGLFHVSGHANRPDLERLHKICDPLLVIPMHGETRHISEHHNLAQSLGRKSIIAMNGSMVEIDKSGCARIVETFDVGRTYLDGGSLIGSNDGIVKTRLNMASRGHISVSILIENNTILNNGIWVKSKGLPYISDQEFDLEVLVEETLELEFSKADEKVFHDDNLLESIVQSTINKVCNKEINKKPVTTIFINRLD